MTFTEYYIEQAKELKLVWKCAKELKKYGKFFSMLRVFLNPQAVKMMYLYDTGKMKPDERYLEGKKEIDMSFSIDEIDFLMSALFHERGLLKSTVKPNDDDVLVYFVERLDKCKTLLEKFRIQQIFKENEKK